MPFRKKPLAGLNIRDRVGHTEHYHTVKDNVIRNGARNATQIYSEIRNSGLTPVEQTRLLALMDRIYGRN